MYAREKVLHCWILCFSASMCCFEFEMFAICSILSEISQDLAVPRLSVWWYVDYNNSLFLFFCVCNCFSTMMPVVAQMMYGSDVLILVHMYPSLFLFHLPSLYFLGGGCWFFTYRFDGMGMWFSGRAPDSWLEGSLLDPQQENFLLRSLLFVLTLILASVPPPCYCSSTSKPGHSAKTTAKTSLTKQSQIGLTKLSRVDWPSCPEWTDQAVQSGLTKLSRVDWPSCPEWTDQAVQSGLTKLSRVDWSSCPEWTDQAVQSGLTKLSWVDWSGCPEWTDQAVQSGLIKLSRVDWPSCPEWTDQAVQSGLTKLSRVDWPSCPEWTDQAVQSGLTKLSRWSVEPIRETAPMQCIGKCLSTVLLAGWATVDEPWPESAVGVCCLVAFTETKMHTKNDLSGPPSYSMHVKKKAPSTMWCLI